MPDGDIFELNVDMTFAGQNCVNVHHFEQAGTDGTGDAREALTTIWVDAFLDDFLALMVDVVTVVQLRCRRIKPTQTQQFIETVGLDGTNADTGMPSGSCPLIRFYTETTGRKGVGGMKLVGASINNVDFGRVNLAYANLMQTFADIFGGNHVDPGSGYTFTPSVYSLIDNVAREIVAGVALTRVRTVHSRQVGVGT